MIHNKEYSAKKKYSLVNKIVSLGGLSLVALSLAANFYLAGKNFYDWRKS